MVVNKENGVYMASHSLQCHWYSTVEHCYTPRPYCSPRISSPTTLLLSYICIESFQVNGSIKLRGCAWVWGIWCLFPSHNWGHAPQNKPTLGLKVEGMAETARLSQNHSSRCSLAHMCPIGLRERKPSQMLSKHWEPMDTSQAQVMGTLLFRP